MGVRSSMAFGSTEYGGVQFSTMQGDEPGYATDGGEVMLHSITLTPAAVALIVAGKAVRVLRNGDAEAIEGEAAGLIVFGRSKADRPRLGR